MIDKNLPGGIWPVMLTPFRENKSIDYEVLDRLTEFYIENGASGLFANCLSSEMYQLDESERLQIIRAVIARTGGRIPVVASGTFGEDASDQADFITKVYDLGASAVVIITSQLSAQIGEFSAFESDIYRLMAKTGDIPLGLYECPEPYIFLVPAALLGRLAATGRFLYFKDTSCNPGEIRQKLKSLTGTKLGLYNANTATALESITDGASGLSPVSANFYPEIYTWFYRGIKRSDPFEMLSGIQDYLSLMDAVTRINYPLNAKIFLKLRGLPIRPVVRVPVDSPTVEERKILDALYRIYQKLKIDYSI